MSEQSTVSRLRQDIMTTVEQATVSRLRQDIMTVEQRHLFDVVNFACLCTLICLFGIVANIFNIIVFFKQGFENTVNISFFALATSDICCLVTLLWICICLNPLLTHLDVPWVPDEFQYYTAAWPHVISARITSYITVYVTGERCVCILAPLKVKNIITPLRTTIIVCFIYILNILTLVPEYATFFLEWKFYPSKNMSLLSLSYRGNREETSGIVFFLSFFTGVASFLSVILFTGVLVVNLNQTSEWRQKATSGSKQTAVTSSRDRKTVKLIIVIASFLIACNTPGALISMVTFVEPEFNMQKLFTNTVVAMWSISCVFQALNSSVNIFFYYNMSSKYRQTFQALFGCHWRCGT